MTGSADDKTLLGAGRSLPDGLCPGQPSESLIEEGTAVAGIDLESKPDQTSFIPVEGVEGEARMSQDQPWAGARAADRQDPGHSSRERVWRPPMSLAKSYNGSTFGRWLVSPPGRGFRLIAGSGFALAGVLYRGTPAGTAALIWSVFPLSAGGLDLCWISAALGGPLRGAACRADGASPPG